MNRLNSLLSAGVKLTSTGTAVASPIPFDSSGYFPRFVRVVASGAGCYVKVGDIGVTAVAGDCMVQPLDGVVLNVAGCKAISAISVSGTSSVTVVPLERGSWNYDQRTLDYDFTTLSAVPSPVTATRGSGGGYFGSDGLYKWQGYNLLLQSVDYTNAVYAAATTGASAEASTDAPFSGVQAALIKEDTSTGLHVRGTNSGAASGAGDGARTVSGYFKAAGRTRVRLESSGNAAGNSGARCVFDLTGTGSVVATSVIGTPVATSQSGTITSVGNGWYRCTLTYTPGTTGNTACSFLPQLIDTGTNTSYTGDGVSGVIVAAPQIEAGSTATQYSPTTTAANSAPRLDYDPATPAGTTGVELVTNGDFSNGTSGWEPNGGTNAVVNGELVVTTVGISGSSIALATTVGKTYKLIGTIRVGTTNDVRLRAVNSSIAGTIVGETSTVTSTAATVVTVNFTAIGTTTQIYLRNNGAGTGYFDNISVQEVTFAPRGLLVEEQRTNNETNGVAFSSVTGIETTTQNAVGPDGVSNSAWTITGSGTNAVHAVWQNSVTPTANNTYTTSVFLKAGTQSLVQLAVSTAHSAATVYCNYNLSTTAPAMTAGAGIVSGSNFQTYIGNGWYRCGFSYVASAVTSSGPLVVTSLISSMADARLPTNTLATTYYRFGGQYESTTGMGSAPFATSYIPTTTASATRSADSVSMTGTNFSSWYNQSAGTFVVEGDVPYPTGAASRYIEVNDGTSANALLVAQSASAGALVASATVTQATFTGTIATTVIKSALCYALNDFAYTFNGAAIQTDTVGALPVSVNRMDIGYSSVVAGRILNGHIRRFQYYPTRLPNATLQSLTA